MFGNETTLLDRQDNLNYIDKYKVIAVREMHRAGIPASIKLAQAILESASGKSELAKKANNHFGIKCGGDWKGKTFKRKDDDYKNGIRIKSCFRVYGNPEESFVAHSNFLTNPRKKSRYGFLFDYKKTDYKKWAKGLKKAGYATNRKYPQLLINLIEEYDLHRFDKMSLKEVGLENEPIVAVDKNKAKNKKPATEVVAPGKKTRKPSKKSKSSKNRKPAKPSSEYGIFKLNNIKTVLVHKDDSPFDLAKRHKVKISKIIKYNELKPPYKLKEGTYIFLQSKKSSFRGNKNFHVVKGNETMYDISQRYGLKLSKLIKRNKMTEGQEPKENENVILKGKRHSSPKLRDRLEIEEEVIKITDNKPNNKKEKNKKKPNNKNKKEKSKKEKPVSDKQNKAAKEKPKKDFLFKKNKTSKNIHVVKKGDTLYRISKAYKISVEDLKKWNKLKNNALEVGQELIIRK